MQREMLNARVDQAKAIVEMGLNMAAELKRDVDAGKLTKEAALAEFGKRANSMTYDKGAGRRNRSARSATPSPSRASTCISEPGPISTISTPS